MAAPTISVLSNSSRIRLSWAMDKTGIYRSFNIYWSLDSGMAGEALLASKVPNRADSMYGNNRIVIYDFNRSDIGVTDNTEFFVRLKGVSASDVEDAANPGLTKLIQLLFPNVEQNHPAQIYGWDYIKNLWKRIKVTEDGSLNTNITFSPGDIEIGAVEIKDHDTDTRVNVTDMGGGDGALDTQLVGAIRTAQSVFSAEVLTNAYVYSSSINCQRYGQAIFNAAYTLGDEASCEFKFQFSHDNTNWYDQVYETLGSPIVLTIKEYALSASASNRIAIPISDMYIRMGIKATGGTPTGTITADITLGWN